MWPWVGDSCGLFFGHTLNPFSCIANNLGHWPTSGRCWFDCGTALESMSLQATLQQSHIVHSSPIGSPVIAMLACNLQWFKNVSARLPGVAYLYVVLWQSSINLKFLTT